MTVPLQERDEIRLLLWRQTQVEPRVVELNHVAQGASCRFSVPSLSSPRLEPLMSMDATRRVLESYWKEHDPRLVAENAVFTMMPTGEEIRGREAIAAHLAGFYHGALDARADVQNSVFADGKGVLEARVVGTHVGEFAGIAPTGRRVDVPLCVVYDVADGFINRARIYLQVNVLIAQIS